MFILKIICQMENEIPQKMELKIPQFMEKNIDQHCNKSYILFKANIKL